MDGLTKESGLRYLRLMKARFCSWLERDMKPVEIFYSVGIGLVGLMAAYSTFQTSRLDSAFTSINDIKVQVMATGKDVEYLRRDMDRLQQATDRIEGKLASVSVGAKPTSYAVKDTAGFGAYLLKQGMEGPFWIYTTDPKSEMSIKKYLEGQ